MIFRKFLSVPVCLGVVIVLQGCGSRIDCNSSSVKQSALEIIQSNLNKTAIFQDINAALSGDAALTSVKTLSSNDELKQRQCSAKYTITYNGKPHEIEVGYNVAYLQDKGEPETKVAVNDVIAGIMTMAMSEGPIKNGIEKITDPKSGKLVAKRAWKNGIEDGVEEIYNPENEKMIGEIHVVNGKREGSEKRWSADGSNLLIDLNWSNGKPSGFQKQFDPTGQKLLTSLIFKDGKATGFQTTGDISLRYDESQYSDGELNGVQKHYIPKGQTNGVFLSKVENYKNGKLDGIVQELNQDGKIASEKNYKDGIEVAIANGASSNIAGEPKEQCLSSKIDQFHNVNGKDAVITEDMLSEWKKLCER
jgi:antitoxin component YwqK of YwqJK toxin-antitoxin module